MPTPCKPAAVIKIEKKSHRTKKELRQREQAEESLLTGQKITEAKEVKNNKIAHKEFLRITKLLQKIHKDDAMYGSVINRYCLLLAECNEFEEKREKLYHRSEELENHAGELEYSEYIKMQIDLSKQIISFDKQIQTKRKMLFDIEKENIMTIASSLRSVPKKAEKKANPLKEALSG